MSAATFQAPAIAAVPTASATVGCSIPAALQQFLQMIGERRNVSPYASDALYGLKTDLESRWRVASSEGQTSTTTLYEILRYGWKEWRRITT